MGFDSSRSNPQNYGAPTEETITHGDYSIIVSSSKNILSSTVVASKYFLKCCIISTLLLSLSTNGISDTTHLGPVSIQCGLPKSDITIATRDSKHLSSDRPTNSPDRSIKFVKQDWFPFLVGTILSPNQDSAVFGARCNNVHIGENRGCPCHIADPVTMRNGHVDFGRHILCPLSGLGGLCPEANSVVAASRDQAGW